MRNFKETFFYDQYLKNGEEGWVGREGEGRRVREGHIDILYTAEVYRLGIKKKEWVWVLWKCVQTVRA